MSDAPTDRENEIQRDKINRIDQTVDQVIQPALKSLQIDVKTLLQRDYITRGEAKETFVDKADYANLVWLTRAIIGAMIAGFFYFIQSGVHK